jgi:hypothetical protein
MLDKRPEAIHVHPVAIRESTRLMAEIDNAPPKWLMEQAVSRPAPDIG